MITRFGIWAFILCATCALGESARANEMDRLLKDLPETQQVQALGRVVESAGYSCRATRFVLKGEDRKRSVSYAVACDNGFNYIVSVNRAGDTSVLDCALASKLAGVDCFKVW